MIKASKSQQVIKYCEGLGSQERCKMYRVTAGTVQPMVVRDSPHFIQHFGLAEYDASKPVVKEHHRINGGAICNRLNTGEITEREARLLLKKLL